MKKITDITGDYPLLKIIKEDLFELTENLDIRINFEDKSYWQFTISKGWRTNFRSGPDCINWFIPKFSDNKSLNLQFGYICHDFLYSTMNYNGQPYHYVSKEDADDMLCQIMKLDGISSFKVYLVRKSLDWFAQDAYDEPLEGDYLNNQRFMKFNKG
jgi:hypothetical protein